MFPVMNAEQMTTNPKGTDSRNPKTVLVLCGVLVGFAVFAVTANWQTDYLLSPRYTLRITGQAKRPLADVRVVHEWGLSVLEHGENAACTDSRGMVTFEPITVRMSLLHRLHIKLVPSAKGLGWENYSSARCRIYLPEGLTVNWANGEWKPAFGAGSMMYTNLNGVFIRNIDRSHRLLAEAARHPGLRTPPLPPPNSPQGDHLDLFFPRGLNNVELQLSNREGI
jgi:hypothetical protein